MLAASNITMQFGAKPLFENVSVKFGDGYRYGLIGANGAGKSTFMKILCGALESSAPVFAATAFSPCINFRESSSGRYSLESFRTSVQTSQDSTSNVARIGWISGSIRIRRLRSALTMAASESLEDCKSLLTIT